MINKQGNPCAIEFLNVAYRYITDISNDSDDDFSQENTVVLQELDYTSNASIFQQ